MPEKMQQQRGISSDLLRGIALWLVVLGHMIPSDSVLYFYINDFHMPLLFFLSGWWASRSFEKTLLPALLLGKAKRLIIPYISWSLVALLFNLFMQYRANGEMMIADTAVRILLVANSVWFFPVLYAAFLLLSAIRLCEKRGQGWAAPIFFIWTLIAAVSLKLQVFQMTILDAMICIWRMQYVPKQRTPLRIMRNIFVL